MTERIAAAKSRRRCVSAIFEGFFDDERKGFNVKKPQGKPVDFANGEFATFAAEEAEDQKVLKSSLWLAAFVHAVFLLANFPTLASNKPLAEEPKKKVFVVEQVRFKPPPPEPVREIPKQRVKRTPMPDATPDDPEPLPTEDPEIEIDLPVPDIDFAIPTTAPPMPEPQGPIQLTSDVVRPVKIQAPSPQYTEIARRARVEGLVIVQAIIDKRGEVSSVKVIRGLPMGLSEEALKAVKTWKFKPATLNGKPVEVYYNLTVNFNLN